jgi:PEGA domain-containing protein
MGAFQNNENAAGRASGFALLLRQIGLGGARFDAHVGSHPPGARILVDGKDTGLRTPALLSLAPGAHKVELNLGALGSASVDVTGKRGDDVSVSAPLWGSVMVAASDPSVPVAIAVDGVPRGFVPATLDSLSPGPHELRFTGPGMASWGTAVEVHVGEKKEVLAYPLQSPATGLLQVRAMATVEGDHEPLEGARVSIDGKPRGVTPLTLELPRGPHSVRVSHDKDEGPIQVIDLPGGNQRFATFELGLVTDFPRIELRVPPQFSLEDPVLVSATVRNVAASELREMWLHVKSPDGAWRRYEMTMLEAQTGAVGAAPFPVAALSGGPAPYYVSALTAQGDEIFTEMQSAAPAAPSPKH